MADYVIDPNNLPSLDTIVDAGPTGRATARVLGGYVGMGLTEIPALPTTVYNMAAKALKLVPQGMPFIGPVAATARAAGLDEQGNFPGEQAAGEISDSIHKNAKDWGSKLAGRELEPGLLSDNSAIDKVGTVMNIGTNMIPIGGGPLKTGFEALKNISTGIKAVDKTVPVMAEAASFLSPFVPTNSPKALIAANLGIGGAIQTAVDLATPPKTVDPDLDAAIEQFKQQWGTVNAVLDDEAKVNTDKSANGVGAAFDAKNDGALQAAIEEFKAVDWSNPVDVETKKQKVVTAGISDLEDYKGAAMGVAAVGILAGLAGIKRGVMHEKMLEWIGGKEFSKAAREDGVSKLNATNLSKTDTFIAQTADAFTPVKRESLKPEEMGARAEKIASAWNVQSTSLLEDGAIANANVRLSRPLSDFVRDMQGLAADPVKLQLFRDAANAGAESNNRIRMWLEKEKPAAVGTRNVADPQLIGEYTSWLNRERQRIAPGTATTQAELAALEKRNSFHGLDPDTNTVPAFGDLLATRRAAMADPVVGPLLNEYKQITQKVGLDYRLEKGLITKKEYTDLKNLHPDYFPVRIEGKHMSSLELSETGGRLYRGDTIKEMFPYLKETVTDVAHEEFKRAAIMELIERRARGSNSARELLGRDDVYSKNHYNADKMVTYRNYKGEARMIEVRDPTYRAAMQGGAGGAAMRFNHGFVRVLSAPSRALEQLTTGPVTAFLGAPFAMANAAYGSVATLINRPAGTVAGVIDKLVQDSGVFGKNKDGINRGLRGDPTFYAQVAWQMLPNITAVLAKNGAAAIDSVMRNHSWMGNSVGAGTLDAMSKSMSNYYKASMVHALEARGLHGGATPMARNTVPTMADLEASLTPATRLSKGWGVTRDFIHDVLGAAGNAPQSAFFRQNKGRMSEGLLTSRTRNVMGDPAKTGLGTSGLGKIGIDSTLVLPWGGVTVQSFSRFAHAVRTNPTGTAAAIFTTVAAPTIAIHNWNAALGPEYVDYEHNVRTPDQVSGSHYIGIPGRPPEEGLEFRIDQLMRPFKVLASTLYAGQTGMIDGSIFKPENADLHDAAINGLDTRYGLWGDAMKSAVSQVIPAVPPALNAAANFMGADITFRSFMDNPTRISENKAAGATDSTAKYTDAKFMGFDISARTEAIFSTLGGQVGRAILNTIESAQQGTKDGLSLGDKTKDFGDRWMMNLEQSTREVSGLWGHAATTSPSQEAASKKLQSDMEGLKKLSAAAQKLRSLHGSGDIAVGPKGREADALAGSGPVQFKDQEMFNLAHSAQKFVSQYNRIYAGEIKDLYEQRTSIMSSEKVSPTVKQTMVNDISKKIVEVNRRGLSAVQQWQWQNSKAFGRNIDLRKIQLDEPITQFKELLPTNP